ncbi:MAG: ABC transporter substrate-binding protein [Ferruginibacter sp.]
MNVGILYPRSKAHPGITQDFMDGIKAFTGQQQNDITFTSESIGYGGSEKEVYEKAEKLLLIDDVDILVAFIGEKVLEILHPLMQSSGKLLLVVHPGANYPYSWMPQPNIIQLTLQDAFLCWLCGQDAGKEKAGDAVMASTFYDCGYLHLATMVKGYTDSGGNIVFNYVNNQAYNDGFHIDEMVNFLSDKSGPQNVLALFDELPASLFYNKLNGIEGAGKLKLYVSPMMLQPAALGNSGSGFKFPVSGYTPWLPEAAAGTSRDFCDAFRMKSKRDPGLFSLLGWETGMILQQISDTTSSGFDDGARIAVALQKITFNGPRGELQLDTATNYFTSPFVRCHVPHNTGQMTTALQAFPVNAWATYIQLPTEGSGSGWTNTYLCY